MGKTIHTIGLREHQRSPALVSLESKDLIVNWQVVHQLDITIPVTTPILRYAALGINLEYDSAGKLSRIVHQFNADPGIPPSQAIQHSERALEPLLETIEFFFGVPPRITQRHAQTMGGGISSGESFGQLTITGNAVAVGVMHLPSEATLADASVRFGARLHLFNRARPPTSDDEAIRLYYLIWEDIHDRPRGKGAATPELRLKHTRDFVSHGTKLENDSAVAFLQTRIKKPLTAFNPLDPEHRAFIAAQRTEAFFLIERELRNAMSRS